MFILLTLGLFLLKFLALGVVGLFFLEDLELTKNASATIYSVYMAAGICTFLALFFFVLGRKLLWLIIFAISGIFYLGMYNGAPEIKEIHQQNDLKSRYFQDTSTFFARMGDVLKLINQNKN
ncbi:MAG: hypothetical protein NC218_05480 [Acetobacter sp.]|nr:hypothetical protein [Acetobacter sp.]